MEEGAGLCGGDGVEGMRSEVGVIREIMVAQAIKDLAGHAEDFGFCSEMGGQRINKMFNGIPLTPKGGGAGPGWRGSEANTLVLFS